MSQSVDVSGKFDCVPQFIPIYHKLKVKKIHFQNKLALCELEIDGKIVELVNNCMRFNCALPLIQNIQLKMDSDWIDMNFEIIYDSLETTNIENDNNRLINKRAIYTRTFNLDDEIGGGNLYVYLPIQFTKSINCDKIVTFKFKFHFQYEIKNSPNESCEIDFNSYYLPLFYTPFDVNFPTGGYKSCIWLPCLNRSYAATPWEISISTPHNMVSICPGNLIEIIPCEKTTNMIWRFKQNIATTAGNIVILMGEFENLEHTPTVIGYSSPGTCHLLESTIAPIPSFIEFLCKLLSCTFPFDNINIVFTSRTVKCASFSNILMFPSSIMCPKTNLLQIHRNCRIFASTLCDLFFGNIVIPSSIADTWLFCGLNRYLYYSFIKYYFGSCEYHRYIRKEQKRASLYPNSACDIHFYLSPHVFLSSILQDVPDNITPVSAMNKWCLSSHPRLLAHPSVWKTFVARSGLALLSVDKQITQTHFLHILSNILTPSNRENVNFHLSTEIFFNSILNITGKDIFVQICRNWLSISRPLLLTLDYNYNRRRSSIEITFTNEDYEVETKVPVNLSITVQESDGAFEHSLQFNRDVHISSFEINTQSARCRRNNPKRRVFTENGREVEVEMMQSSNLRSGEQLTNMDNPVLWIRVNLDNSTFYGDVRVNQPDHAWYYQASIESNPCSHLVAVKVLKSFPCDEVIHLLSKLIKTKSAWYLVRAAAFKSLVMIHNQLTTDEMIKLDKDLNPIDLYRHVFGHPTYPEIPRINDFSNISPHLFQLLAIKALSKLKMTLLKDVHKSRIFLSYELLRTIYEYNDNSSNVFEDCCYRAHILTALGDSLSQLKNDLLQDACSYVLNESLNCIKLEELNSYVHGCFSFAALSNLLILQKLNYIPFTSEPFVHCSLPGIQDRLRILTIPLLAQYIQLKQCVDEYKFLLDIFAHDPSPLIQQACLQSLIKYPPFQYGNPNTQSSTLSTPYYQHCLYQIIETLYHYNCNFPFLHQLSHYYDILYNQAVMIDQPVEEETISPNYTATTKHDPDGGLISFILNPSTPT